MKALSSKQHAILDFIGKFVGDKGYPPSVRDIQRGCDISSTSVVDYNLRILQREGRLHRDPDVSRGIELKDLVGKGATRVPMLGVIAAGEPIPAPDEDTWTSAVQETMSVPADMIAGKEGVYALRVQGTSMIDALIDDGDVVLLQQATTADNGEMVAAWIKSKNEATLKKFYREKGRVRLQPANSTMKPIYVNPRDVSVQGKVVGVIRKT